MMFYARLDQILLLIVNIALMIMSFRNYYFQNSKTDEYKNDERWRMILAKRKTIVLYYYDLVMMFFALCYTLTLVFDLKFTITESHLFLYGALIFLVRTPVEYFALRYYDKHVQFY